MTAAGAVDLSVAVTAAGAVAFAVAMSAAGAVAFAVAVTAAGTVMFAVVVMVAVSVGIKGQFPFQQGFHCLVRVSRNAAVKLDSGLGQSVSSRRRRCRRRSGYPRPVLSEGRPGLRARFLRCLSPRRQ